MFFGFNTLRTGIYFIYFNCFLFIKLWNLHCALPACTNTTENNETYARALRS